MEVIVPKKILGFPLMIVVAVVSFAGCATTKPHVEYYENGQLKQEGNYKNGIRDGEWIYYLENGQIGWVKRWKKGKKDGQWIRYDEEGSMIEKSCYEVGRRVDCGKEE